MGLNLEQLNDSCTCGLKHSIINMNYIEGEISDAPLLLKGIVDSGVLLLIADTNTWQVAGQKAMEAFGNAGYIVKCVTLNSENLHADETSVDQVLQAAKGMHAIVAVGSGTIGDICRYVANEVHLPFITIGTALSMDGYSSSVAPLIINGFKRTMRCNPPVGLLANSGALLSAPKVMSAAGVGDMAGKLIAILDWQLANFIEGEAYCSAIGETTLAAANRAIDAAIPLSNNDPSAAQELMSGLVLSGLMITKMGNSRPASGSEHMIAHYTEILDIKKHKHVPTHGTRVGVGTLIAMDLYKKAFDHLRPMGDARVISNLDELFGDSAEEVRIEAGDVQFVPETIEYRALITNWDELKGLVDSVTSQRERVFKALIALGGMTHPREMGLSKEDALSAILHAKSIRTRFCLLRLLDRMGWLKDIATQVVEEYYAE